LIENCNLPIHSPLYMTHKLQEKPSALKREHPALQNMKILYFFYIRGTFLPSWIRIRVQQIKLMRIRIHNPAFNCLNIMQDDLGYDLKLLGDLLNPLGCAIGVWLVGNVGR
jgi:hypothetical protein